ncbi:protein adenylyltransferase SelO [Pseudoneobacillus sp. C159]
MEMKRDFGWSFDNSYASLPAKFFTLQKPTPVRLPKLVIINETLAADLGLDVQALKSEEGIAVFAGNQVPDGATPLAQAYAGHQFGHFTMLGDGRAILLGEQITPKDERFDIQLKGPGRTPYSRGGDGRAALGPMLREYIISEAMHALNIPTTRSLAVVKTGEITYRETELPGAILTRVAASHIRVGTFQYAARSGNDEDLRALADYTINRHYPKLKTAQNEERYLAFLNEVIKRQAQLIAKWQLVGFIHGVMNTDNMTISGETIDYGPCAFMDTYDPATVFSSIDREGRYAYGNQPYIGLWNLTRFAETLLPLLNENQDDAIKLAEEALGNFGKIYQASWTKGMRAKLGIFSEEEEDKSLIENLLNLMQEHQADYTNTFRALTLEQYDDIAMYNTPQFKEWLKQWQDRLTRQSESKDSAQTLMRKSNPAVIPRNHRVEEALESAVKNGDYQVMEQLLVALSNPYDYTIEQNEYTKLPVPSSRPYRTFCGT